MRTRAYRRYVRNKSIIRKKGICLKRDGRDWYSHDGQYSKGKIHCGCGICKFGKKYHLSTLRDERELALFQSKLKDLY